VPEKFKTVRCTLNRNSSHQTLSWSVSKMIQSLTGFPATIYLWFINVIDFFLLFIIVTPHCKIRKPPSVSSWLQLSERTLRVPGRDMNPGPVWRCVGALMIELRDMFYTECSSICRLMNSVCSLHSQGVCYVRVCCMWMMFIVLYVCIICVWGVWYVEGASVRNLDVYREIFRWLEGREDSDLVPGF